MRVLMLSWEFPPHSVGGIAPHVYDLTRALVKEGTEVHVISAGGEFAPEYEEVEGVHVHRVRPYEVRANDFVTYILQLNVAMQEKATALINRLGGIDAVHAHDWLVAFACRSIKHAYNVPLVATIHATEHGRNNGLHNDLQRYISSVEWWLTYEAWQVIVCSHYMKGELRWVFQIPEDKVSVIHNGVNVERFLKAPEGGETLPWGIGPHDKVIFFVGRLVQEKGVQVLLEAMPRVLWRFPEAKAVIAGKGPQEDYLRQLARFLAIEDRVLFTGYIDDAMRNSLYRRAELAVVPSLYEPFGIVALEAMAAGTPVLVSDVGGLGEIIQHHVNGLKTWCGDPMALANNINHALANPGERQRFREEGRRTVNERYTWSTIAKQTLGVYRRVVEGHRQTLKPVANKSKKMASVS